MNSSDRAAGDRRYMDRALDLALRGWGRVAPNPLVGAVIVREGKVVGEGWHAEYGCEHAETAALRNAGEAARGATLYVSLEPCRHRGQTPPCTSAIIEAGVRRVVIAVRDPSLIAAGGARDLIDAGLEVEQGIQAAAATRLNAPFLWRQRGCGPWVSLKLALTLDARIAAQAGQRTQITGPEAEAFVHRLRAGHDAVLVGGRTAAIDDPHLTSRGELIPRVPPARVVLDPELRLAMDSALVRTATDSPVVLMCRPTFDPMRRADLERRGVQVQPIGERGDGGLDLSEVFDNLADRGLWSVLVEGGGRLASALLEDHLVQRQFLIYAPLILGSAGVSAFAGKAGANGRGWQLARRELLGRDTLIELDSLEALELLGRTD